MKLLDRLVRLAACATLAVAAGGANLPSALVGPGEWEVSTSTATSGDRVCLMDPTLLLQWEHRGKRCERAILSSSPEHADVQYHCTGGGFGTSKVEELTPRTVRIESQGISDGYPFAFVLHARRVGPCQSH